jgi:hypothetical protein
MNRVLLLRWMDKISCFISAPSSQCSNFGYCNDKIQVIFGSETPHLTWWGNVFLRLKIQWGYSNAITQLILSHRGSGRAHGVYSMLASALPKPETRSNRSSGLIRNSYLLDKQMIIDNSWLGLANTQDERFTPFFGYQDQAMTVDIWIRDYNPPRCFQ